MIGCKPLRAGRGALAVTLFSLLGALAAAAGEPPGQPRPPQAHRVPAQYIVVLHDHVANTPEAARDIGARTGGRVGHVYESALKGFVVKLPPGVDPAAIRRDPRVAFIEQDSVMTLFDHVADETPTGVNRINAHLNPTTGTVDPATGAPTDWGLAVIDTGIQRNHPDLNVVGDVTFVLFTSSGEDDHGHGTHVAGTIGARD